MGRSKRFRNLEPDCFLYSKYGSSSALVTLTLRLIKFEKKCYRIQYRQYVPMNYGQTQWIMKKLSSITINFKTLLLVYMLHILLFYKVLIRDTKIEDFPRFRHRGVLVDTARHYIKKETIFQIMVRYILHITPIYISFKY